MSFDEDQPTLYDLANRVLPVDYGRFVVLGNKDVVVVLRILPWSGG